MRKSLSAAGITLAIVIPAGACARDTPSQGMRVDALSSPSTAASGQQAGHNGQDVTFARQLILNLSQTRDMAKLVPLRSNDPVVVNSAARIMRSQNPDIQQLMSWLNMWGEEFVPATDIEAVQQLERADAGQFGRMWTQMTIERHQDAVALAKAEVENGAHPAVRQFAQKVIDTRQAEITEMQKIR